LTDGSTAVHRACYSGNDEALQILIQYHANVGIQDDLGRAPAHWASVATTLDCLQVSRTELTWCFVTQCHSIFYPFMKFEVQNMIDDFWEIFHEMHDSSSIYAGQSSSVFEGKLHMIHRHWQSTASLPSPSFCATSSLNFWPSGLCCCWSDGVELSTWQFT